MKKIFCKLLCLVTLIIPILSVNAIEKVSCGNVTGIPSKIPELTNFAMTVIQILVPIILVIMGSVDLVKGISSQKEDEIKKGQQILIKRIIVAMMIFFVIVVVKFLVSIVASGKSVNNNPSDIDNIVNCIDCFLNGKDKCR